MVDLYFCLGALVLFTIGFRLVKLGNPYKRGGGDSYTKRRMFRMLGWMMWTSAGVMVALSLINELSSDQLTGETVAQSTARPEIASVRTQTTTQRMVPNLIRAPALKADALDGASSASPAPDATGSLTLVSIQAHPQSMTPTLINSAPEEAPAASTPLDDLPQTPQPAPSAVSAPADASPADVTTPDTTAAGASPAAVSPADVSPSPPSPTSAPAASSPASTNQLDAELAAADAIVKKNPSNVIGYVQRGNVYGNEKRWDLAKQDYAHALELDSKCVPAAFNMAELDFMQGHYDKARPGFLSIVNDSDFGDLAKYKVFLCDLFGGHEEVAAKELAVFNQVGSDASYYFANVAWSLYHKKNDEAQSWWDSATHIFAPDKINLYAKPLIDLGYVKVAS